MRFLFCRKNQKNVLQKETKDWTFEADLLTDETISWFLLTELLKMTFESVRLYVWVVLEFFIKQREKTYNYENFGRKSL